MRWNRNVVLGSVESDPLVIPPGGLPGDTRTRVAKAESKPGPYGPGCSAQRLRARRGRRFDRFRVGRVPRLRPEDHMLGHDIEA